MANRLSHSQVSKWQQCPTAFKHYYVSKIRTTVSRAALCFGTAIDKSTGLLLEGSTLKEAKAEFDNYWSTQDVNGNPTNLATYTKLVYAKGDFDKDLLSEDDAKSLETEKGIILDLVEKRNEKGFDSLTEKEKLLCNQAFWFCLQKKGHYMLEAFKKKVIPRLTNVLSTQEKISITNDDGDEVIGYIDLVSEVKGYDVPVILDIKTSAMKYDEDDAVIFSPQLSLYMHAVGEKYGTRLAGFIVLNKNLIKNKVKTCKSCKYVAEAGSRHKTCSNEVMEAPVLGASYKRCNGKWDEIIDPEVYVQFLVEEIPDAAENLVMENVDEINQAMKNQIYTKNLLVCNNIYGSPCEYINLCWKNSMQGLVNTTKK